MTNYDSRRFAIVIASCDKSEDLWKPLLESFARFWPDCPVQKYLITNLATPKTGETKVIAVGDDRGWSANLKRAAAHLEEDYLLLHVDDLFLVKTVDTARLAETFCWVEKNAPNCVRLNATSDNYPVTLMPRRMGDAPFGALDRGWDYRVSTVLSLWKRQTLMDIICDNESAWEFEIHGSLRSDRYEGFYGTFENFFQVSNAVIRGKWRPSALVKLRNCGLDVSIGSRPVMGKREIVYWYIKERITKLFSFLSPQARRKIRLAARRMRQA